MGASIPMPPGSAPMILEYNISFSHDTICLMKHHDIHEILNYQPVLTVGSELYTIWRDTLVLLKFGKIDDRQRFAKFSPTKFYTCIESHVNIKQIDWKIFPKHMPKKLQLGYH